MNPNGWSWSVASSEQQHRERVPLMREIMYETTSLIGEQGENKVTWDASAVERGKALSLNISSGGMLLLMESAPNVNRVFKVQVPTPVPCATTPTLAEVRWIRDAPLPVLSSLYFVGVRFLF